MKSDRSYSELIQLPSFDERFAYLALGGRVGEQTFGGGRHLNQAFYQSHQWRTLRTRVIARDLGRDLALEGYEIFGRPYVHHITPISRAEIVMGDYSSALSPDNLITVSFETHEAIHYGGLPKSKVVIDRTPNDTKLW